MRTRLIVWVEQTHSWNVNTISDDMAANANITQKLPSAGYITKSSLVNKTAALKGQ